MSRSMWLVTRRDTVANDIIPHVSDLKVERVGGLVQLLRKRGKPLIIAVDGAEHELRLADAALKIQLRFPDALLVVLFEDSLTAGRGGLLNHGVDELVYPAIEWAGSMNRFAKELAQLSRFHWVGKSDMVRNLSSQVALAAPSDIGVLITGESGAGKELVAKALHQFSPRSSFQFVAVNTGAIPATLLESELFGHEKGAFTGAVKKHRGIFEVARGGTVFLDEVGDMPQATQVSLLRVLESKRFRRLGSTKELESDIRLISATHRDLSALEAAGTFRRDLYYRLSAITLRVAPLRDRKSDILPLLFHFWNREDLSSKPPSGLDPEAVKLLWSYSWPGNIRELRNFADATAVAVSDEVVTEESVMQFVQRERARDTNLPVVTHHPSGTGSQDVLLHAILHLGRQVRELRQIVDERLPEGTGPGVIRPPAASVADAERTAIESALLETGGNRRKASRLLGIGERTLYRKISEYGLN